MKQKIALLIISFYVVFVPVMVHAEGLAPLSDSEALVILEGATTAGNKPVEVATLSSDEMQETQGARWWKRPRPSDWWIGIGTILWIITGGKIEIQ